MGNIMGANIMGADISECGLYRYGLTRRWGGGPECVFVMLNPSTADAEKDDPTIRRCVGFAKREGCGSLRVVNLFAFRATSPADMKAADDPVGPENDEKLAAVFAAASGPLIAGWGAHGGFSRRDAKVIGMAGGRLTCLGKTKDGHPRHPLYVRSDKGLEIF